MISDDMPSQPFPKPAGFGFVQDLVLKRVPESLSVSEHETEHAPWIQGLQWPLVPSDKKGNGKRFESSRYFPGRWSKVI